VNGIWDSEGEAAYRGQCQDLSIAKPDACWYALHLHAKHEKKVASQLTASGLRVFVPAVREVHRWSDRRKVVEALLFPCYAFVHARLSAELQAMVLRVPGVFRWLAANDRPSPVPDDEIAALQIIVAANTPISRHEYLLVGQRVRVRGGCLEGLEGVLVQRDDRGRKLVVSVGVLQQSIAISTDGYDVEPIGKPPLPH
jgi:transcription antitermination factor NusG